jgi:hypothetical protein
MLSESFTKRAKSSWQGTGDIFHRIKDNISQITALAKSDWAPRFSRFMASFLPFKWRKTEIRHGHLFADEPEYINCAFLGRSQPWLFLAELCGLLSR